MYTSDKPRFRLDHGRLIPITRMPYGYAAGSMEWASRGRGILYANITIWPKLQQHALYDGHGTPHPVVMVRGTPLWSQEMYVYLRQRKEICWGALEKLEKVFVVPRIDEKVKKNGKYRLNQKVAFDPKPHPEDFGGAL